MANRDVGNLRRGPWLDEEDERLTTIVKALGDKNWDALANESGTRNVAEQDLSTPKCHRSPEYIIGENERDGVFGTSSTEAPEISSNMSAFGCSSPYERQITDWMSSCCWLLHDDNQLQTYEIKQHEDYMGMYPCFCQPESKPEEDMMHNVCDLWSPIWEMG
ncbi:hypothetical protein Ccrd_007588 [Cynara cardunculus var. scolymus]|uniref:Uncharacterized protein n=1 Tax=Cynara cardunculus var. scolymus TaxID=59895 RepID=A0A103XGQ2_CYNCS|nr:hypothetical protein Ccrd_007588 [Cynara cardunculus var. scolymus]